MAENKTEKVWRQSLPHLLYFITTGLLSSQHSQSISNDTGCFLLSNQMRLKQTCYVGWTAAQPMGLESLACGRPTSHILCLEESTVAYCKLVRHVAAESFACSCCWCWCCVCFSLCLFVSFGDNFRLGLSISYLSVGWF